MADPAAPQEMDDELPPPLGGKPAGTLICIKPERYEALLASEAARAAAEAAFKEAADMAMENAGDYDRMKQRAEAAEAEVARLREASKRLLHVVGHSVSLVPTGNGSTEWRYIGDPAALAGAFANFPALTQPSSQEDAHG